MSRRRKDKQREYHEARRIERQARLDNGIYGKVQKIALPPTEGFFYEPPSYNVAKRTSGWMRRIKSGEEISGVEGRCFYTGVPCYLSAGDAQFRDCRREPWLGTRDHLVPARRDTGTSPFDLSKTMLPMVWASNIANCTFGLAPLLVRLTVRRWLKTTPFDRNDTSHANGMKVRWIIINMMDHFRVYDRFPWSRKEGTTEFWNPLIANTFMKKMWDIEREFIRMKDDDREKFIKTFKWQF